MNSIKKLFLTSIITCVSGVLFSQNFTAEFIKSVTFNTQENINPIIQLGKTLKIGFDDLEADQKSYKYIIQHCNYNWEISNLQSTEYINGFQSFEILDMENSFGTYQNYTHHKFEIPNRNTRIKISGNFLLTILNDDDEICIQRRFVLYESQISIIGKVVRDRSLKNIDKKQVVNFSIIHPNVNINNPSKDLKVVILQNNDWNLTKLDIKPQYYKKNEIVYNYNAETSYFGSNEFLNFDTKNFNATNVNIVKSVIEDHYYQTYLYPNQPRNYLPYTYYPDINGGFVIRTLNGTESTVESEYTNVRFHLKATKNLEKNESIYIYGAFNNYAFTEQNRLKLNKKTNYLETEMLFKQGFYNYIHVIKDKDKELDTITVDGSYQETENNYTILVYYQPFGERIQKIVGYSIINSKN
ncbi:DUF5103 domain-containing protein [Flavicella sp.]|uniref:type IX secretion system plug protein n=1 Tax=Flavicella sp. TaxID=2957742 RepID=UPI003015CF63